MSTRSLSAFPKPDLEDVRAQFRKLEGGQVTLTKNEQDGIALIELDHPGKKNGMSGKMMVELNEVVTSLESWTAGKGVIFYGKGDMFSSGGYLGTVRQIANPQDGYRTAFIMHDSLLRLSQLPLVSLSIIQGKALGGGAEMVMATDFRLMCSNAQIAFVEARMGVGTGWGGGYFLTKLVGRARALDLLLTCRPIDAAEGYAMGLVQEILPPDISTNQDFRLEFARAWLQERIKYSPAVVQAMKKIVASEDLELEREYFASIWGGHDQLKVLHANPIKHR